MKRLNEVGVKFPGPTRQNENPPFRGLCQLRPGADIATALLGEDGIGGMCPSATSHTARSHSGSAGAAALVEITSAGYDNVKRHAGKVIDV
jgi:hypothetical protein